MLVYIKNTNDLRHETLDNTIVSSLGGLHDVGLCTDIATIIPGWR